VHVAGQLGGGQHRRQGAGAGVPLDVAVAVVDVQGIAEKPVGQGGPGGRHALAGDHDGGLVAAELFQGGLAHDVGHRCLRSGDHRPQVSIRQRLAWC
jgi:hypothetical protein